MARTQDDGTRNRGEPRFSTGSLLELGLVHSGPGHLLWSIPTWPVQTASLGSFDPVFSATEFGPSLDSEIRFISQGDKPAIGGTSDLESWILSVLAKRRTMIFKFGTCTGKTTYHLDTIWRATVPPRLGW